MTMMLDYRRTGGFKPPQDNERLEIWADGQFRLWRSVSWTTYPPTPIGRFAGRLTAAQQDQLQAALAPTAGIGPYRPPILPDSAIDFLIVEGQTRAMLGDSDDPEGPWEGIITLLREWYIALTQFPQQAIGLAVAADGQSAQLRQLGPRTLPADLTDLSLQVVLWEDQWSNLGEWWAPPAARAALAGAPAAWPLSLPFDHGFVPAANQEVVAYVNFVVDGDDGPVAVALESARRLG